eukprot:3608028-Rhodomonas_salina.1
MYRLPWPDESVTAREPKKSRLEEPAEHPILAAPMVLPSLLSDEQRMQVEHDRWGHPSESTARKNYKHRQGKSFPRDFLQLLPKTSCLVCPLAKGARPYKHTTRFKEVGLQRVPVHRGGTTQASHSEELTVNVTDDLDVRGLLDGRVD